MEEIEHWVQSLDVKKEDVHAVSVILSDEFSTVAELKQKKPTMKQLEDLGIDDEKGMTPFSLLPSSPGFTRLALHSSSLLCPFTFSQPSFPFKPLLTVQIAYSSLTLSALTTSIYSCVLLAENITNSPSTLKHKRARVFNEDVPLVSALLPHVRVLHHPSFLHSLALHF